MFIYYKKKQNNLDILNFEERMTSSLRNSWRFTMRNKTTKSSMEDRNELLRLSRINSVVYHDVSVKSHLSRYFRAFPVVFMSVVLPRSCSSGLKGSFCLHFLMSCQTCMTSIQFNSHLLTSLCCPLCPHNESQCCSVPNVLQKILTFHWRKKVIQVWNDTRASKWRQNDDYFLLNYHSKLSEVWIQSFVFLMLLLFDLDFLISCFQTLSVYYFSYFLIMQQKACLCEE